MLYKGYFPLINYDDEPSVSMGILSQLPSSHLPYTECQPSYKTGSCPTEKTDASYSSCFLSLIVTDPHSPVVVLIFSVDAIPLLFPVGLLQMQSVSDSIVYGFLFQNPLQSPMPSIRHSTEFWIILLVFLFLMLPMMPVLILGA